MLTLDSKSAPRSDGLHVSLAKHMSTVTFKLALSDEEKKVRITIQTAGLAFGGTGLCSYRVRGVDGSCAKHLTVESHAVIYAANSHTYYC